MADRKLLFVLTDDSGSRALAFRSGGSWELPKYGDAVPEKVGFAAPGPFNEWFARTYGIRVIRRYALDLPGADAAYFILKVLDEHRRVPDGSAWLGANEFEVAQFREPAHGEVLRSCLVQPQHSVTMRWSDPRAYEQPMAWMRDRLREHGRTLSGTPEQVTNAYVSTVMRCPTNAGDVYLKLLPDVFIREASVLGKLRDWGIPELPRCLAVDAARGLMLMEDMGGCDLADCCTPALLGKAVREFADFQVASTSRIAPDRPSPFYDWRMEVLAEETEHIADDAVELLADSPYELTESEGDRLRRRLPGWADLCRRIMETPIPDALDHGDLRPGNIRIVGDRVIFYDWAWSAITHPFLSIASLLHVLRSSVGTTEGTTHMLRDAYLERWSAYAPPDELRRVFGLVDRAKAVYGTVADATWLKCLRAALAGRPPGPASADAWTVRWRQHYYAKMVRRLIESEG